MSVFDADGNPVDDNPITENFLDHLVGDGKKFTDPEALAKGKYEADKFVKDLERQNAELREDIGKATQIEELMTMVREQNKPVVEPAPLPVVDPSDTSSDQMTPEALKALIETHVNERDLASLREKNVAQADRAMTEKFGDSAGRVLSTRASELGMSLEDLKEVAAKNPTAFSALIGTKESTASPVLLGGVQRSESGTLVDANARDSKYYNNLRKTNKAAYYQPKVQQQMIDDAQTMGAAFYGNS